MTILRTIPLIFFVLLAASQTPVFMRLVRDWERTMFNDGEHQRMLADMFSAIILFPAFTMLAVWRWRIRTPPTTRPD